MKLISFEYRGKTGVGLIQGADLYSLGEVGATFPQDMQSLLAGGQTMMDRIRQFSASLEGPESEGQQLKAAQARIPLNEVRLLAPVPRPASLRDAYAFRQHVETSRRNRGLAMIPEFDQFPVFYFSNHRAICGPGDVYCMPDHFDRLDFELEVAIVLNKQGRNIPAAEADDYIAGFMIMNDLSARTLQMEEMKLNLGPAKGKDFATALGPWLVTPDELAAFRVPAPAGHTGQAYRLEMCCRVNGKEVSRGSMAEMHWTFAEIIERASYGVDLFPGDVIGSGTVGTGCFLELNGTGMLKDPAGYTEQWLQPGDQVELEVSGLGILSNLVLLQGAVTQQ